MVAPVVAAAAISAGASILGGAMGGGDSTAKTKRNLRQQYQSQLKYGTKFQGAQLERTVESAKRAGLHPLFALGGASSGGPSFSIPGQSSRGSAKQTALEGVARAARTWGDQTRLIDQANLASALRIAEQAGVDETGPAVEDLIKTVPVEIPSRSSKDSSQQAGTKPAWMKIEIVPGVFMSVPSSDEGWAESLEGVLPQVATLFKNSADLSMWMYKKGYQITKPMAEKLYQSMRRKAKPTPVRTPQTFFNRPITHRQRRGY